MPMLLAVVVAAGCAPRDRAVRLARLEGERRNLEASLDRLEERLLADQSRVRFWREMKDRHEGVSAISCAVQDEHAEGMALHGLPSEAPSLNRAKVAAASSIPKPAVRTGAASPSSGPRE
jgi:hypothetical protein